MLVAYDPGVSVTQECARCAARRVLKVPDLRRQQRSILLPACACGAQESLVMTVDVCPPAYAATPFAAHRRIVNRLGAEVPSSDPPVACADVASDADVVLFNGGRLA